VLRLWLSVRGREDSSFHHSPGKSLLAERVMSQKQAERGKGKAERRAAEEAQGQAATLHR